MLRSLVGSEMCIRDRSMHARDMAASKQRDVELATCKFYQSSTEALRQKVLVMEAIRWVGIPIAKSIDHELLDINRTINKIQEVLKERESPYQATLTCIQLRAQRPARDKVEDEADECLEQQLVSLEIDATERLRRAITELEHMSNKMAAMQDSMEDDVNSKGRLVEVDVRCLDLQHGRPGSDQWNELDCAVAGWDASVAPWGSSQVQWDQILQQFDDNELPDQPGVISMPVMLTVASQICTELPSNVLDMMVAAADRDDDGTINHEEYVRSMRQFVLFQSAKSIVKECKRLRAEVDRVMHQLDMRIGSHHTKLLEALRASSATTCAYISQMEDKLSLNADEIERIHREIRKIDKKIGASRDPLRVAEQRLNIRERRPVQERWNDNPEEHLDTEVDGIKNVVCLLEDELENLVAMRTRLRATSAQLEEDINSKRVALDIDTSCFNIQTDWKEFLLKYEVVPAGTPASAPAPARPPRELPSKSEAAKASELVGNHPGWWCERAS
eukprot:TRINITY_DN19719_c0_g1_i3.p1 TRINITY_DN19719_c0_g1~~TRINITY_DN19719_c0_g1_i3.p1  ORF type:complete len:503 (+),score=160.89 TRINITY_DN19719_c0_g1_i3:133-1641(+)